MHRHYETHQYQLLKGCTPTYWHARTHPLVVAFADTWALHTCIFHNITLKSALRLHTWGAVWPASTNTHTSQMFTPHLQLPREKKPQVSAVCWRWWQASLERPPPASPVLEPAAVTLSLGRPHNNLSLKSEPPATWNQPGVSRQTRRICHSPLHSQSMQSGPGPE